MRLTADECRTRFGQARAARLATIAEDGSPRLVPITFALAAEPGAADLVFSAVDHKPKSTTHLARLARIEREPRVALLADDYDEEWSQLWWVRVDAHAEVLTAGPDWETAIAGLQEKYEQYLAQPPVDAVIRFAVDRWTGWSAGEWSAAGPRTT